MDKESEFVEMNKKYYSKVVERKGTIPIVFNTAFGYCNFPGDSTKRLETKEFYLQKSKNQNTAAWVLLGAGTTLATFGIIGISESYPIFGKADQPKYSYSIAATVIGIAADALSISLFIKSSRNKKLATSLSFDNQNIYSPLDKLICRNIYPSLTLRIRL